MPKTKKRKKTSKSPVNDTKMVVPEKIVPMEIRRIMSSHRNSPNMATAVMEFVNQSARPLDKEAVSLLTRSSFTAEQIPKMSAQSAIGFNSPWRM